MEEEFPISSELFILLVEERPILWDKSLDNYKNKVATQNSWKEILINIYPDFETWDEKKRQEYAKKTVKKWTYIRDTFLKSKKKIDGQRMSGSGAKTSKPYVYHAQLSFLTKTAQPNITVSSIEAGTTIENNEENCTHEDSSSKEYSDSIIQNNETQVIKSRKTSFLSNKSLPKRQSTSKLSTIDAKMINFLDSFPSQAGPINRHISFFNGLIPTLDKFNDDQVIEFQLGVIQLMKEIKNSSTAQRQAVSSRVSSPDYLQQTRHQPRYCSPNTSGTPHTNYTYPATYSQTYLDTQRSPVSQDSQGPLSNYSDTDAIDFTTF